MRQNKFYGFMKGFLPVVVAGTVIFCLSRNISRENSNLVKKLEIPKQVQIQAKTRNLAHSSSSQASQDCSPQEDYAETFERQEAQSFTKAMNRKPVNIDYNAIEQIESAGNPKAYNKNSGARGLRQITPIVLEEWNQFHLNEKYNLDDLFDSEANRKIGNWYIYERIPFFLRHYSLEDSIENRLAAYNWGIGNLRKFGNVRENNLNKLPDETRKYIEKYRKLINP